MEEDVATGGNERVAKMTKGRVGYTGMRQATDETRQKYGRGGI